MEMASLLPKTSLLLRSLLPLPTLLLTNSCLTYFVVVEPIAERTQKWEEGIDAIEAFPQKAGICLRFTMSETIRQDRPRSRSLPTRWLLIAESTAHSPVPRRAELSMDSCLADPTVTGSRLRHAPPMLLLPMQGQYAVLPPSFAAFVVIPVNKADTATIVKDASMDSRYELVVIELANGQSFTVIPANTATVRLEADGAQPYDPTADPVPSHHLTLRPLTEIKTAFVSDGARLYVLPMVGRYGLIEPALGVREERHPEQWARVLLLPLTVAGDVIATPVVLVFLGIAYASR